MIYNFRIRNLQFRWNIKFANRIYLPISIFHCEYKLLKKVRYVLFAKSFLCRKNVVCQNGCYVEKKVFLLKIVYVENTLFCQKVFMPKKVFCQNVVYVEKNFGVKKFLYGQNVFFVKKFFMSKKSFLAKRFLCRNIYVTNRHTKHFSIICFCLCTVCFFCRVV